MNPTEAPTEDESFQLQKHGFAKYDRTLREKVSKDTHGDTDK